MRVKGRLPDFGVVWKGVSDFVPHSMGGAVSDFVQAISEKSPPPHPPYSKYEWSLIDLLG